MAVLVTGGAGYIGSHMVYALVDAGEDVVVLDKLTTGFRWAVAPQARFYFGDVGDADLLSRIFLENDITAILHFAGSVVVPESIANPLFYYDNNTGKTRILLQQAVRANIPHLIFSSTAAVYAPFAGGAPVPETALTAPQTPYGMSKLMSEQMLKDTAHAHELSYVALRYFNVAGSDEAMRTGHSTAGATHLIKAVCETATGKRERLDIYGTDYPTRDGTAIRDFIHVSDLVAAHLDALTYLRAGGESLVANCGYGAGYSVQEVVAAVSAAVGHAVPVRTCPRREGDLACVIADATLARQVLGWQPRHDDLGYIVRTALAWEDHLARRVPRGLEALQQRLANF